MNVKRNLNGPTSWVGAMAKSNHLHDSFTCGHAEEDWHIQVRVLKQRIEDETSKKMADLLTEEVNEVLSTKKTTKDMYWKYKHANVKLCT
jgi:hypothetical protein